MKLPYFLDKNQSKFLRTSLNVHKLFFCSMYLPQWDRKIERLKKFKLYCPFVIKCYFNMPLPYLCPISIDIMKLQVCFWYHRNLAGQRIMLDFKNKLFFFIFKKARILQQHSFVLYQNKDCFDLNWIVCEKYIWCPLVRKELCNFQI